MGVGSAAAYLVRSPEVNFGPLGHGAGTFPDVQGIAVDQATGNVYVYVESDGGAVYKFNSSGEPVDFSATDETNEIEGLAAKGGDEEELAISEAGPGKGELYVAEGEGVEVFALEGAHAGEKLGRLTRSQVEAAGQPSGEPCGVAVDAAGDVYVGLYSSHVNEYTPTGEGLTTSDYVGTLSGLNNVCNLTVDPEGNVYVDTWNAGPVTKYLHDQFGLTTTSGEAFAAKGSTLGVDPLNHEVDIDSTGEVRQYSYSGEPLGAAGGGELSGSFGVAAYGKTGQVYAADGGDGRVVIYGVSGTVLPGVLTKPASGVMKTAATLQGDVNPSGLPVTKCEFEWGETTAYGHMAGCSPVAGALGAGNAQEQVTVALGGLHVDTTYHYRLVASDANGTLDGEDESFSTPQAVEGVRSAPPSEVLPVEATLHGSVEPNSVDTKCYFEYGSNGAYGARTPLQDMGSQASGSVAVNAPLAGLAPAHYYNYRIVCEDSYGEVAGENESFETPPAVAGVNTEEASEFQTTGATLNGSLEPRGVDTECQFDYGTSPALGSTTPLRDEGSALEGRVKIGVPISGLEPNQTYYARLYCENQYGVARGFYSIFTTFALGPSISGVTVVTDLSKAGARFTAMVDPEGSETYVYFQYGETEAYGMSTTPIDVGSASAVQTVGPVDSGELIPGTTYHVRVVAANPAGTVYGPDATFTTSAKTPPLVSTGGASAISQNDATVSGVVNSEGLQTVYGFEIGTSPEFGPPTGLGFVGAGGAEQPVSLQLAGLLPDTTYYYRIEATTLDGTAYGAVQTFTTSTFANAFVTPPSPLAFVSVPAITFPTGPEANTSQPAAKHKAKRRVKRKAKKGSKRTKRHAKRR
ncbi:MAG TPA: hypothetical protein VNV42_09175 [Solirubrobacteraceae bacterium]|nr:hypothetical protein [Solirubrobacteraceae bacterium]